MGVDPIREYSLVGRAKLSGAGQHAAAIHAHWKIVRRAVFQRHDLARQLVLP
jgi:hypothetical protein